MYITVFCMAYYFIDLPFENTMAHHVLSAQKNFLLYCLLFILTLEILFCKHDASKNKSILSPLKFLEYFYVILLDVKKSDTHRCSFKIILDELSLVVCILRSRVKLFSSIFALMPSPQF